MRATLRVFLGLVFRPLKGVWNVIGVGLPGAAVAVLWTFHHPALAWWLALVTLLVLLVIAGYRLQKRLLAKEADQGFLDYLGRALWLGGTELTNIEFASEEFGKLVAEMKTHAPLIDAEAVVFNARMEAIMAKPDELKWRQGVTKQMNERLPHYYSALLDNIAGLAPAEPP